MTTSTLNQESFIENYAPDMGSDLATDVINQYGGFDVLAECHADVCNHGIDSGFNGWIATHDMVDFYAKHEKTILNFAKEYAKELGYEGLLEMVSEFNRIRGEYNLSEIAEGLYDPESEYHSTIAEMMAWFVAEEMARAYERMVEDLDQ